MLFTFELTNILQENEYVRIYEKRQQVGSGRVDPKGNTNEGIPMTEEEVTTEKIVGISSNGEIGLPSTFTEDVLVAVSAVEQALLKQKELLGSEGLLYQEGDKIVELSQIAASLQESRQLCRALSCAVDIRSEDIRDGPITQFSLGQVCNEVFALLETAHGARLPLFADDNLSEVCRSNHSFPFHLGTKLYHMFSHK
jgi:hypothetical protein